MEKLPPIIEAGHQTLRKVARKVDLEKIQTQEFQSLIQTMIEVMRKAPGVGLAAPQIGIDLQVIILEDHQELMSRLSPKEIAERERVSFPLRVLVNPQLKILSESQSIEFFEGCLSVPGYKAVVKRYAEVQVDAFDENAQPVQWKVRGWPARILQHEVDHLKGILIVDRMNSRTFSKV